MFLCLMTMGLLIDAFDTRVNHRSSVFSQIELQPFRCNQKSPLLEDLMKERGHGSMRCEKRLR